MITSAKPVKNIFYRNLVEMQTLNAQKHNQWGRDKRCLPTEAKTWKMNVEKKNQL